MKDTHTLPPYQRGMTLIELVITIAILGILTSIAIPSYRNYVQKGNRPIAKTSLLEAASKQEAYYALNNAYASQLTTLGYSQNSMPEPSTSQNYYTLTVQTVTTGTVPGYVMQATPTTGSSQATDSCAIYQLDNLGNKTNVTSTGASVTTSNCW